MKKKSKNANTQFISCLILTSLFFLLSFLVITDKFHLPKVSAKLDIPKNGETTYKINNNYSYIGKIKNTNFIGEGILKNKAGNKYEGNFKNNDFSGFGKYFSANGWYYFGNFKEGLPDGEGTFYLSNGDSYNGLFKRGMRSGFGVYTKKNKTKITGEWNYNLFVSGTSLKANSNFDVENINKNNIKVVDSLIKEKRKKKTVMIIGDSLTLDVDMEDSFDDFIPGVNVDAAVSRRLNTAGLDILREYKRAKMLSDIVVIALSTNGTFGEKIATEAIKICGEKRDIIFVTGYHAGQSHVDLQNNAIRKVAKKYNNVYVSDWEKAVKTYNYTMSGDKTHIGGETANIYARLIAAQIKKINSQVVEISTPYNNITVSGKRPFYLPVSLVNNEKEKSKLNFKSSNEDIATVFDGGIVFPKKEGQVDIIISYANEKKVKVRINIITKNITQNDYSDNGVLYIEDEKKYPKIRMKIRNRNTVYESPQFEIEDRTIATVDESGIIYSKKVGSTRIKCTLENYTGYIDLTVKRK